MVGSATRVAVSIVRLDCSAALWAYLTCWGKGSTNGPLPGACEWTSTLFARAKAAVWRYWPDVAASLDWALPP